MIDEYAYNFLFPFSSVGSSGTAVSGRTNDRFDDIDSSYHSLANLRKSEICTYKSILRNNSNLTDCDYFRPSVSQPINSQKSMHDIQTIKDSSIYHSITDEVDRDIKPTNTEPGFIVALSSFLTQIATSNSSNSSCNVGVLTPFHSVCIPPIPIRAYLIRLAQNFGCSNECFVLAIIYVGRIIKFNKNFTITLLNVHRIIVTALILATKFFDDIYYSNAFYAKISGVGTRELNSLEIHFLRLVRFQLFVTEHEYEIYKRCILNSAFLHSTIPSLPVSIFDKQVSDEFRGNHRIKDISFIGERKRLSLQNSFPYNYNYPGVYNSLLNGEKFESRDIQSMLIGDYSLSSQARSTGNLYTQKLNSFNSNADIPSNCDFCSNQTSEIINSELTPSSQCAQNYGLLSEKWVSQQLTFSNSGCVHNQIQDELCADQFRGLVKDERLSRKVDKTSFSSGSNVRNDYLSINLKHSSAFNNGYARTQIDNSERAYNANLNSSNYLRAEIQSSDLTQRRIEGSEIQIPNMHPEYKGIVNLNYSSYSNDSGYYNSVNASDINVLSTTGVITSSTVTLVNPTVNRYGQHIFMNPYNVRCTTGIDRRLLV
ncbi:cyclin [Cryptosporidium parvum Iowa II]|uniref:Cyclin n=3 Tax=Cryptosporidium parvum TaxID=5807 RepID=Q5CY40_CRYPI|nr:cyclin [Cryptosporidium parvum Iowa II]EAK90371.1 cyclin [Cryptosporidium parvum Iowa II]QOY40698.1 Cyclin [Cryptosporidium parvum]WKS79067.1 cyclin [Cryptosporidium sp. 43IA8]WRK33553.1 Cyclin [Cryptosporidium parvum]|eukprot:QOY40698.1 hypothetical protein CPATCC_003583 [Cryptosporidium parvum]